MILNTYFHQIALVSHYFVGIAKIGLTVTLFLIGAGLNINVLKSVGIKALLQGSLLWIFIATATLFSVIYLK
jgi:uncharacterized membrane protein YadS